MDCRVQMVTKSRTQLSDFFFSPRTQSFTGSVYILSRVQLFATLWSVAGQAPLSMRFSRQEYWSGLPFPSPGNLPKPGIELTSPALAGGFFTASHLGSSYDPAIPLQGRATQDRWGTAESSDKTWSTGEGNGRPLQYSFFENPTNSMKRYTLR